MRAVLRHFTAWAVTTAFVVGALLPAFGTSAVADPDGNCGPVIVLAHSVEHFEAPLPAPTDHCALCHLWSAVANASVSDRARFSAPDSAIDKAGPRNHGRVSSSDLSPSSPRGPPAVL